MYDKIQSALQNDIVPGDPGPSWRALAALFSRLEFLSEDEIWMGAAAVYGWMPTTLGKVYDGAEFLTLTRAIRARAGIYVPGVSAFDPDLAADVLALLSARPSLLAAIQSFAGTKQQSVVGTSKFLHFLVPHILPIWDSRVRAAMMVEGDTAANYLEFSKAVHAVIQAGLPLPAATTHVLLASAGFTVPAVRLIEFNVFQVGAAILDEKSRQRTERREKRAAKKARATI